MKLTKIIVSSLLIAAMALSMAACDSGDNSASTTEAANKTTAASTTAKPAQTTITPVGPATTAPETGDEDTEVEIPDDQVYSGMWFIDNATGHYLCTDFEQPNPAIIPIGDGYVPEGVTKYSLEVTSYWGQSPEWGIIYAGKDVDGDGKLLENFDYYRLFITNTRNPANCANPGHFDLWDEINKDQLSLIDDGPATMKIIVDTVAGTVEFYINDLLLDTRSGLSFAEYGNMIGVCSKVLYDYESWGEFWDLKFTALN